MSLEIVLKCAEKLQANKGVKLWDSIDANALYFHPKSNLDSLAIVDLLVSIISETGNRITVDEIFTGSIPKTLGELGEKVSKLVMGKLVNEPIYHDVNTRMANILEKENTKRLTKLVIFDCDDTLWGGIAQLGAVKVRENITAKIQEWDKRGCVFALCSKNDYGTINPLIIQLEKQMQVYFISARINWEEKGKNVVAILNDCKLLPENTVFVDNDPFERGRVSDAVPGIWCPEMREDGSDIDNVLKLIDVTIPEAITDEDKNRAALYWQESKRKQLFEVASNYDEWLKMLDIKVNVRRIEEKDIDRAKQLVEKAHQWKLSSVDKIYDKYTYVAEYSDTFGYAGVIGVVTVELSTLIIYQFVMSCRVIGRGVEKIIYDKVCGLTGKRFELLYNETEHNRLAVEWAKKVNAAL